MDPHSANEIQRKMALLMRSDRTIVPIAAKIAAMNGGKTVSQDIRERPQVYADFLDTWWDPGIDETCQRSAVPELEEVNHAGQQ